MKFDPHALTERLGRAVTASGLELPSSAHEALGGWLGLIATWNAKIDLTAARTEDELVDLMVADALVLAARMGKGARAVDVGTGAGAPGLALALMRPDVYMMLVEPLQKRVAFLRTAMGTVAKDAVARRRLRVERGKGEELAAKGARFDVALSRATLAPPAWLGLGARLGREVWVLLAREEPPTLAGWAAAEDVRYRWPLTGAERRAVRYVPAGAGGA